jgi:hypothetical protein
MALDNSLCHQLLLLSLSLSLCLPLIACQPNYYICTGRQQDLLGSFTWLPQCPHHIVCSLFIADNTVRRTSMPRASSPLSLPSSNEGRMKREREREREIHEQQPTFSLLVQDTTLYSYRKGRYHQKSHNSSTWMSCTTEVLLLLLSRSRSFVYDSIIVVYIPVFYRSFSFFTYALHSYII